MTFVGLLRPGPQWWPGRPIHDQGSPIQNHLTAMRRLHADGLLRYAGSLGTSSGIVLLATADEGLARAVLQADPAVAGGVLRFHVRELTDYPIAHL